MTRAALEVRPPRVGGRSPRWAAVDVARGVAILAVVAFHATWDLGDLGLISWRISAHWSGKVIAHSIAGSFLFLVGVSLVLAHGRGIRWWSFWRREAQLVLLALLVSAGTWAYQPRETITFGILHDIAVVSLVCVLFVRLQVWTVWVAGVAAVALPQLVHVSGRSPWVSWTGLADGTRPALDWQPVLPWIALAFAGVGLMRWLLRAGEEVPTVVGGSRVSGFSSEEVPTVVGGSRVPRGSGEKVPTVVGGTRVPRGSGVEVPTVVGSLGISGVSGVEVPTVASLRGWRPASAPARWLGVLGRHTLAIYLIHQPMLYGALWLLANSRS